jgi:hypothetical protein
MTAVQRPFLWRLRADKRRNSFFEIRAIEMTDKINYVAAGRASSTVPKLLSNIDCKAVYPAAAGTGTVTLIPGGKPNATTSNFAFDPN